MRDSPFLSHLIVRELPAARFDQAYPLARGTLPGLTLEGWRTFLAALLCQDRAGLLAVENRRGVLFGLAAYRQVPDPQHGPCLDCDPVVVFELLGAERIAEALIVALERQARRFGCERLHSTIVMPAALGGPGSLPDTPLLRSFSLLGHRIEATRLCKTLDRADALN